MVLPPHVVRSLLSLQCSGGHEDTSETDESNESVEEGGERRALRPQQLALAAGLEDKRVALGVGHTARVGEIKGQPR